VAAVYSSDHASASRALDAARGKLSAYTALLWDARETAPADLKATYSDRLASAAKVASMLERPRLVKDVNELIRLEDHCFPRAMLATDAGREARSAFNSLARSMRALADLEASQGILPSGLESIVGAQLSAVTFVMDYIQLAFDGRCFTVLCPCIVSSPNVTIRSGEIGFRDQICTAIARQVTSVQVCDATMTIGLQDFRIAFDLTAPATAGGERLLFDDGTGRLQVWT
jgi:hypothetical protein